MLYVSKMRDEERRGLQKAEDELPRVNTKTFRLTAGVKTDEYMHKKGADGYVSEEISDGKRDGRKEKDGVWQVRSAWRPKRRP